MFNATLNHKGTGKASETLLPTTPKLLTAYETLSSFYDDLDRKDPPLSPGICHSAEKISHPENFFKLNSDFGFGGVCYFKISVCLETHQ